MTAVLCAQNHSVIKTIYKILTYIKSPLINALRDAFSYVREKHLVLTINFLEYTLVNILVYVQNAVVVC